MPDHTNFAFRQPPPLGQAQRLWPGRARPQIITDQYRVMLADPDGSIIGFGTDWGRNSPAARIVYAQRNSTRDF